MEFTLPSNTETKGDPICSPHWCHHDTDSKPSHELNEQILRGHPVSNRSGLEKRECRCAIPCRKWLVFPSGSDNPAVFLLQVHTVI
ncbi:unnamed protein product [Boreogadus saida]